MQEQELIDESDYSLLVSIARARGELGFIVKWAVDQGLEVDWDWYSGWDWSPAKWNVHSRFEYETDTCCRNSAGELVLPRGVARDDVSALQLGAACASGDTHRVESFFLKIKFKNVKENGQQPCKNTSSACV